MSAHDVLMWAAAICAVVATSALVFALLTMVWWACEYVAEVRRLDKLKREFEKFKRGS